jgi:acyl-coenzyme A synthetase/AMP-(fatty) acid ligase
MEQEQANNITDSLFDFARENPDRPAILHPILLTYSDLCTRVDSYASGFLEAGIVAGTKTIVLVKQGPDFFIVVFALFRIGAVPVMIDPGMGIKAMSKALVKTEAEAFVGIPRSLLLKFLFPESYRSIRTWISTGFCFLGNCKSLQSLKQIHMKIPSFHQDPGTLVAIFYTSGSTGPAKAVMYKKYMLAAQIKILRDHFGYKPGEIDLCTFPLIGLLLMSLGISTVLADMDMTKPGSFNPLKLIGNINDFSCTHMFCSPMILGRLATYGNINNLKVPSLARIMTAGAPVLPFVLRETRKWIPPGAAIHTPYGATEALPVTDICDTELLPLYENMNSYPNGICVGYPIEGIDLKIIHIIEENIELWEDSLSTGDSEIGEITIKGPNVSQEYLADNDSNRRSKIFDSATGFYYHRTGDLGRFDKSGRVWFYGRKSQRVVTDGPTLFTITSEAVFNRHPYVSRSALVGINTGISGRKIPIICIELRKGFKSSRELKEELLKLGRQDPVTRNINHILFHKKFPVDPRHNAKIYREKLTSWAQKRMQ